MTHVLAAVMVAWHLIFATMMMMGVGGGTPPAQPAGYQGPADLVASPSAFWGLRAVSAAYAAAQGKLINACLPLDALCTDINSDTSGNLSASMLATLGCNNTTSICTVKTLYDQSGALACAASTVCDVTQATAGNRPTLVLAGAANGCPSTSLPCMAFVLASAQCLVSANSYTQAQPLSIENVSIRTGNTSTAQRVIGFTLAAASLGYGAANLANISFGTLQTVAATDSAWHALQGIGSNTVGALAVDGATTAANNGINAPAAQIEIGARSTSCVNGAFDGKMTETGVWPIAFSAGNIADLNSNAHSYWGF